MKKLAIVIAAIFGLLLLAAMIVPFFIPTAVYKSRIEAAAIEALDRDVELGGDLKLTILPMPGARIDTVRIGNPDGFAGADFAKAGSLRGRVKLLPLLFGRVEVAEIALIDAELALEQLEDGSNNWTLGKPGEDEGTGEEGVQTGAAPRIDRARLVNAKITYRNRAAGTVYVLDQLNLTTSVAGLDQPLSAKADGRINTIPFDIRLDAENLAMTLAGDFAPLSTELNLPFGSLTFTGKAAAGSQPSLDGQAKIADLDVRQALATFGMVSPATAAVGKVDAVVLVKGSVGDLLIDVSELKQAGPDVSSQFEGRITLADAPRIDEGRLTGEVTSLVGLLKALSIDVGAEVPVQQMTFETVLSGPLEQLDLTGLRVEATGPEMTTSLAGRARIVGSDISTELDLSASTTNLPALIERVSGAPATLKARSASFTSRLVGTPQSFALPDLSLTLGESVMSGNLQASLNIARPKVSGQLNVNTLDLGSLLVSSAEAPEREQSTAWSNDPLGLPRSFPVDADIRLAIGTLKSGKIEAQDVTGRFLIGPNSAEIGELSLNAFSGIATGGLKVLVGDGTPRFSFDLSGSGIEASDVTSTFAGLSPVRGNGDVLITLTSSGDSQKSLFSNLEGSVSVGLQNGAIKGVNLAQLIRSAQDVLTTGRIPSGLSAAAETDFTSFSSVLSISEGVASVGDFELLAPFLRADGSGQINLATQSLDVRLFPKAVSSGQGQGGLTGVKGYGIPVRFSGSWTGVKTEFDRQWLIELARDEAIGRFGGQASTQIRDRLGDTAGGAISDALGLPGKPAESDDDPTTESPPEGEQADPTAPSPEDQLKDAARRRLLDALKPE